MSRNYEKEYAARTEYIRQILKESSAKGIVFGNSGGKDSALCGILCRAATEHVLGVQMPCESTRNFGEDLDHAILLAEQYGIKTCTIDLTSAKQAIAAALPQDMEALPAAQQNIAPRLRMTTLYTIAQSLGYLVCGTGNASEYYMGYFTKWGDGAFDFNPIADLHVSEILLFLAHLKAPEAIFTKAPSAGLFEGQTDEHDMGVTYALIERYIAEGTSGTPDSDAIIARYHERSHHKRSHGLRYAE